MAGLDIPSMAERLVTHSSQWHKSQKSRRRLPSLSCLNTSASAPKSCTCGRDSSISSKSWPWSWGSADMILFLSVTVCIFLCGIRGRPQAPPPHFRRILYFLSSHSALCSSHHLGKLGSLGDIVDSMISEDITAEFVSALNGDSRSVSWVHPKHKSSST